MTESPRAVSMQGTHKGPPLKLCQKHDTRATCTSYFDDGSEDGMKTSVRPFSPLSLNKLHPFASSMRNRNAIYPTTCSQLSAFSTVVSEAGVSIKSKPRFLWYACQNRDTLFQLAVGWFQACMGSSKESDAQKLSFKMPTREPSLTLMSDDLLVVFISCHC